MFRRSALVFVPLLLSSVMLVMTPVQAVQAASPAAAPVVVPAEPTGSSGSTAVQPIDWAKLHRARPVRPGSEQLRSVLLNSNRYALTTWWESRGYDEQPGRYLQIGHPSGPAYESFALAVSLATNAYDADRVGVARSEAEDRTLKLVRSMALSHRSNTPGGWGGDWQGGLRTAHMGYAGWMLWDDLSAVDREYLRRAVEDEAERLLAEPVPYYRDESGTVIRPGDTAAEENAWNSMLMSLATAMMPRHPNWSVWMDRNLELMISAFSRPENVTSERLVNGKPLSVWLNGSNIENNGLAINHGIVHPDYMTTLDLNLMAGAGYTLAGKHTPEGVFLNAKYVYDALVDHEFASPPYRAPGGTIYVPDAAPVYYPQGTDWSPSRIMIYGSLDVMARSYGFDDLASTKAQYWENLHVGGALAQQSRHPDGKMFAPGEFTSEENDGAVVPARAYLTEWLASRGLVKPTDRAYPVNPHDRGPALVDVTAPAKIAAGEPGRVVATFENLTQPEVSDVGLSLTAPDGWTVEATSPTTFDTIGQDQTARVTWDVTPGHEAVGLSSIEVEATYSAPAGHEAVVETARVFVDPEGRVPAGQVLASASDAESPHVAARAIDGDLTTLWHSRYRPVITPFPHALTLRLGGVYNVAKLYYQPRLDGSASGTVTRYKVYASADGATFTEVASGEWALDDTTKSVSVDAPGARYVRLEALDGGNGYASAAEVVLVGEPRPERRIPLDQMTATASDYQSPYVAGQAIDGDLSTLWHSQYRPAVPFPHSVTLRLASAYDITALSYEPRGDGSTSGIVTRYKVYASTDGTTYSEVAEGTWPLDATAKVVTFDASGARYIRFQVLDGDSGYASVAELALIGDPAARE